MLDDNAIVLGQKLVKKIKLPLVITQKTKYKNLALNSTKLFILF